MAATSFVDWHRALGGKVIPRLCRSRTLGGKVTLGRAMALGLLLRMKESIMNKLHTRRR